mmetsp:Transcript_41852/g.91185  ORF Transcript_41852/g.91185 Transcript_41852/m.91185 type:complete len:102 (-) Transcript_41852:197-502(-)
MALYCVQRHADAVYPAFGCPINMGVLISARKERVVGKLKAGLLGSSFGRGAVKADWFVGKICGARSARWTRTANVEETAAVAAVPVLAPQGSRRQSAPLSQ